MSGVRAQGEEAGRHAPDQAAWLFAVTSLAPTGCVVAWSRLLFFLHHTPSGGERKAACRPLLVQAASKEGAGGRAGGRVYVCARRHV